MIPNETPPPFKARPCQNKAILLGRPRNKQQRILVPLSREKGKTHCAAEIIDAVHWRACHPAQQDCGCRNENSGSCVCCMRRKRRLLLPEIFNYVHTEESGHFDAYTVLKTIILPTT